MKNNDTQRGIIAWFASNPVAANLLMIAILVFGVMVALNTRTETFPSLPPKAVTITVVNKVGTAKDNEEGIALKVEDALQGVQGIKEISSISTKDSVTMTVERTSEYNLDALNKDIKNKVDSIVLPNSAEKPVITKATFEEEAVVVHVFGEVEHQVLQETARRFRKQLLANSDIKKVETQGKRIPELNIEINEQALQTYGLSLQQVVDQINATSFSSLAGELQSQDRQVNLKAGEQLYRTTTFGAVDIITTNDGQKIPLTALANLNDSYKSTPVLSRYQGKPSVSLHIKLFGDSDVLNISQQVKQEIQQYQSKLPNKVELGVWNDSANYITDRLSLLADNALSGLAIVAVMLALFLNLRVAFWVAVSVPVVFAGAMILMSSVYNITINELSTFGFIMALGIVVDDAVVVGESIHASHLRNGTGLRSTILGVQRVSVPTIFGVLTSMVAFQAISMVEGEMGSIFAVFSLVIVGALLFSMIESKLIMPAHLAHLSHKEPHRWNVFARLWGWLQGGFSKGLNYFAQRVYRPLIYRLLSLRYAVLALSLVLMILVIGMVQSGRIGAVFFPDVPSDIITINLNQQDDVGYGLTHRQGLLIEQSAQRVNQKLRERGESQDVIEQVVVSGGRTQVAISASLISRKERVVTTNEVVEVWRSVLPELEAVKSVDFVTSWQGTAAVEIQLRSEEKEVLNQATSALIQKLESINGVTSTDSTLKAGKAQITLALTPQGKAMGLSINDLASQIQLAYHGQTVQKFQRGMDEVEVKIAYPKAQRQSFAHLGQTRIRTKDGQLVPLDIVATLHSEYVSDEINRKHSERVATITAKVNKNLIAPADVNIELDKTILAELQQRFPSLSVYKGGEAAEQAETQASMQVVIMGALIGIYALLAIPLKSYFQPLIIMVAIPFGVIGALLGHWLYAMPISLLSIFGIIALSGVVVNDSLLLVSRYNELCQSGMRYRKAIAEAASQRMRAIILTSLTTFAGLLPLMSETSENAQFLIPAALSIAYGSLFATVITLLIIPNLLMIVQDFNMKRWFRQRPKQVSLPLLEPVKKGV